MSLRGSILFIIVILAIDQISKIYVKTNFIYGEAGQIDITNWFKILLIENEGMAWGTKIPGQYGKLTLTVFRIFAVMGIAYWLYDSSKKHSSNFLMVSHCPKFLFFSSMASLNSLSTSGFFTISAGVLAFTPFFMHHSLKFKKFGTIRADTKFLFSPRAIICSMNGISFILFSSC